MEKPRWTCSSWLSSPWSSTKEIDTFNPLSNSPPPEKVNWLSIEKDLPELAAPPLVSKYIPAADVTSPAIAVATRTAKAENPQSCSY